MSSIAHGIATKKNRGIDFNNLMWEKDYHDWNAYGASKLANVYFTRKLAKVFKEKDMDIKTASVHPGVIKTNLARSMKF